MLRLVYTDRIRWTDLGLNLGNGGAIQVWIVGFDMVGGGSILASEYMLQIVTSRSLLYIDLLVYKGSSSPSF